MPCLLSWLLFPPFLCRSKHFVPSMFSHPSRVLTCSHLTSFLFATLLHLSSCPFLASFYPFLPC